MCDEEILTVILFTGVIDIHWQNLKLLQLLQWQLTLDSTNYSAAHVHVSTPCVHLMI